MLSKRGLPYPSLQYLPPSQVECTQPPHDLLLPHSEEASAHTVELVVTKDGRGTLHIALVCDREKWDADGFINERDREPDLTLL